MRWKVHGRRTMYESDWVNVYLDDVELPDGEHIDHHVLDFPKGSAGAVVHDERNRILMIWRHRFITDSWGWEVPAGWIEASEDPETAVLREIEEETGYAVDGIAPLVDYFPLAGISTQRYRTFVASRPRLIHDPEGPETEKVEWKTFGQIRAMIAHGEITDGPSLLMLSTFLALHVTPTETPSPTMLDSGS